MVELKYAPVAHNQKSFLQKASKRRGFRKAYVALKAKYALYRSKAAPFKRILKLD